MTRILETLIPSLAPRETVALASINAARKAHAQGKRNHNGRFIRPMRVPTGHGAAR